MTRKTRNGRHLCKVMPLHADLVDAVNALREQVRRKQGSEKSSTQPMFARDLVQFGSILGHWPEVVGRDVAEHAWPVHLMYGRLSLVCEDSQWLHHLTFLKTDILQRMKTCLPQVSLREISGKVGPMPVRQKVEISQPWPEWQQETEPDLPPQIAPELRERIARCARKSQARIKGFLVRGFKICPVCHASTISQSSNICGICVYRQREEMLRRVRFLLSDQPWLSHEQVVEDIAEVTREEYDLIRRDLILETRQRIALLGPQWLESGEADVRSELEREIIREIMLASQISPDQITLDDPNLQPLLDPEWICWLNTRFDAGDAC